MSFLTLLLPSTLSTSPALDAPRSDAGTPALTADDLTAIRRHADWRRLFVVLGVEKDPQKSRDNDWWGKSPFKPTERTASFHIGDRGWYCHATSQGGGPIELVQRLHGIDCYQAGRWLLEQGVSSVVAAVRSDLDAIVCPVAEADKTESSDDESPNQPIKQDLRRHLDPEHPAFVERGIPADVLRDLGAGFLQRPPRKNGRPDPMNQRLVFQIRGLNEDDDGLLTPVILGHIGRATSEDQERRDSKWWTYAGFKKRFELYNLDQAVLDDEALAQAAEIGHVIVVEGCFDVAKLHAAGIFNVVATLGSHVSDQQLPRFELLHDMAAVDRFLIWYDRDQDGTPPHGTGAVDGVDLLTAHGYEAEIFDWKRTFNSPSRGEVPIPAEITDPCEFSVQQLQWLRDNLWI